MAVTKLELQRHQFFPRLFANESMTTKRLSATAHRFAAFLWQSVGANDDEDRSGWDAVQWQNYLTDPRCEFYVVYCDDEPAGCCEIVRQPKLMRASSSVRIKALGLFPEYAGEGLGSALLTRMVEKALATGAHSVTVRTSADLSKETLQMFRAQGFRVLSDA